MGLALPVLRYLIQRHAHARMSAPVLTLGVQSIGATNREVIDLLRESELLTGAAADDIAQSVASNETATANNVLAWMGLGYCQSMDLFGSEGATIVHDLNEPVPTALRNRFNLIIDGGTLEHIFDIRMALENVLAMLRPGGTVIHISPVSGWDNHGFYSINPKLLARFYESNATVRVEAALIHLERDDLRVGRLVKLTPQEMDDPFETDSRNERTLLYFCATCAAKAARFTAPVDTHQPTDAPATTSNPMVRDDLLYWEREEEFHDVLNRASVSCGQGPRDRYFVLKELLMSLGRLDGDTAECGVFQGLGSKLMLHYAAQLPRCEDWRHHLFDSFEGMSPPTTADHPGPGVRLWQAGDMTATLECVLANLDHDESVVAHAGWIPACFADAADRRFAFVHVDVDLYEPTREALAFFVPRLIAGGILLLDDDGFLTCPGARKAVDEFVQSTGHRVVRLPTGQAFFVKTVR